MAVRIEFGPKGPDAVSERCLSAFQEIFGGVEDVEVVRVLTVAKDFSQEDLEKIAAAAMNPVTEEFKLGGGYSTDDFEWAMEVGFLPGVTDNVGHTARELIEDLLKCEFGEDEAVFSSTLYLINGEIDAEQVKELGESVANLLIQRIHVKGCDKYKEDGGMDVVEPKVKLDAEGARVSEINLEISDDELEELGKKGILDEDGSRRGPLALTLLELKTIRDYFRCEERNPTDVELEAIAQTWSEHCKHKIFASPLDEVKGGLYRDFIKKATNDVRKAKGDDDFCVSVFSDNAGAIKFNENFYVTDKAETHNSPSALDPFGGAITGIVGVNRDALGFGMGAKPIVNRYGFCFADPRDEKPLYRDAEKKDEMLPPARIAKGVIEGVEAGGNQSGIPGPQGFLYYNERYKGKPLVFVGTVGMIPVAVDGENSVEKSARDGDLVVVIGGRVGQDGIHGATFSSESLDAGSPSTAVQIGDPITQKRFMDAVLYEARDKGLYNSITDNGAGGISCSVAEMAKECGGCEVDLEKVPLKYPNLEPWKIWISESQERMTFAVPTEKWGEFDEVMKKYGVEATVIGKYTDSGRCVVKYEGKNVLDLDMEFLHEGVPLVALKGKIVDFEGVEPEMDDVAGEELGGALVEMMGRLNVASFSGVSTIFDHEVQGRTVIKPLQGVGQVNGTATAFKPDYDDWKGVVLSQGLNPLYSDIDTYHMAACAIDTAVRNAVAAGGNVDHMALMDNFCWCSSNDAERLGQLKKCVRACYEYAVAYGTPYISGKDSMFNDFNGYDEDGPVKISVPPTLLISSMSVVEDVRECLTIDTKMEGDLVYVIGITRDELGGSEYYAAKDEVGANVPQVDAGRAVEMYRAFYKAVREGLMASAISVGIGGLGVAFGKMAVAGGLGMSVDLGEVAREGVERDDKILFSESQSRIVVTVNPELKERFEEVMTGFDVSLVGEVGGDVVKFEGMGGAFEVGVEDLKQSYMSANKFY